MRSQKGYTLVELLLVVVVVFGALSWIMNAVKLTSCDFEPNYRCEIIHGLGLIPALAFVTVWARDDGK